MAPPPRDLVPADGCSGRRNVLLLLATAALVLAPAADATALTYRVAAHEKACFYTMVPDAGKKISFYFAVQSGGSFDVDYTVSDPKAQVLLSGEKERQGDYVLTANQVGEFSFCFSNRMSTFVDKVVEFEISGENEHQPALADASKVAGAEAARGEHTAKMDEASLRMMDKMLLIQRLQRRTRTREHRNMATVQSTESRIFYFSVLEGALIVTVAVVQVFIIRTFFGAGKKGGV